MQHHGPRRRKSYDDRVLANKATSRRFRAGSRKNKRLKNVGSFGSDRRG